MNFSDYMALHGYGKSWVEQRIDEGMCGKRLYDVCENTADVEHVDFRLSHLCGSLRNTASCAGHPEREEATKMHRHIMAVMAEFSEAVEADRFSFVIPD